MKSLLIASVVVATSVLSAQDASELAFVQSPFRVYSAFWPNLHHVLLTEAMARRGSAGARSGTSSATPATAPLTLDERRAWDDAVSYYERQLADRHPLFDMGPIRKAMLAATAELPPRGLEPAHGQALAAAAPVYRSHWWRAQDLANRAWIEDAMSKVVSLSPGVPERLASLYKTPWFTRNVRVDVVPIASREGAFTATDPAPAHITISSSSPIVADWTAAEVLFHESSHGLALPMVEAFAIEAQAQGKNARDFWHVALFYMTGEVVRQALAGRGITYEPYLYKTGLLDRVWPQFKPLVETHWRAYVNGEISREDAIRRIVASIN
jgi:hypothetical protein